MNDTRASRTTGGGRPVLAGRKHGIFRGGGYASELTRRNRERDSRKASVSGHPYPIVSRGGASRGVPEGYVASDSESSEDICMSGSSDVDEDDAELDSRDDAHDDFIDDSSMRYGDDDADRSVHYRVLRNSDDEPVSEAVDLSGDDHSIEVDDRESPCISVSDDESSDGPDEPAPRNYRRSVFMGVPDHCVFDVGPDGFLLPSGHINHEAHEDIIKRNHANILTGPMGCGKTTLIENMVKYWKQTYPGERIIYISNSRNLCRSSARKLGLPCYLDMNLRQEAADDTLGDIVVCINSLWHLRGVAEKKKYDRVSNYSLVIIDEMVSVFNSIYSGDLIKPAQRSQITKILTMLCNLKRGTTENAATVVMCDALFNEREMWFVKKIVKTPVERINVFRFFPRLIQQDLPEIVYVREKNRWIRILIDRLIDKPHTYRTVLMTCLRDHCYNLLSLIKILDPDLMNDLKVKLERAEQMYGLDWLWVDSNTDVEVVTQLLADPDALDRHDRFAFTPVFQAGVSFLNPYDVGLCIAGTFMPATSLAQMLRRVRKIKEKKIYLHLVGNTCIPSFPLELDVIKQNIRDFRKLDDVVRSSLAECLSVSVRNNQRRVTDYFTDQLDDDVLTLMAYTVLEALKFKYHGEEYLKEILFRNDPHWKMSYDNTEIGGTRVDSKRVDELTKAAFQQVANDIVPNKHDSLMCNDWDLVKRMLNRYNAFGCHLPEDLKIKQTVLYDTRKHTSALFTARSRMGFTPLALLSRLVFLGFAPDSTPYNCLKDAYSLGMLVTDMFLALGSPFADQVNTISRRSGSTYSYIMLDLDTVPNLRISTHTIIGNWKSLVKWVTKYRVILAVNSINSAETVSDTRCPNASETTNMKDVVCAVLGLFGFSYKLTRDHVLSNGKRKRCALRTLIQECTNMGMTEFPPLAAGPSATVTLSVCAPEPVDCCMEYCDKAFREELKELVSCGKPVGFFSERMPDDEQVVDFGEKNRAVVSKFIQHLSKVDRSKINKYLDSPSFWLVQNPEQYDCKGIMIETFRYMNEFMKTMFESCESFCVADYHRVVRPNIE